MGEAVKYAKLTSSSSSCSSGGDGGGGGSIISMCFSWSVLGMVGLVTGMVVMEGVTVGLTIWTKTVMAKGLSAYVYVVYTNALASTILLLCFFIFHRPKKPYFTFALFNKFFFLGLIGITMSQMCAFNGLSYSSPIVVASMSNLLPTISLLLAFILRTGKLDLKKSSSIVKLMGMLISLSGAAIVTIYKGPSVWRQHAILSSSSSMSVPMHDLTPPKYFLFASTPENWVLGCFLLAAATLCSSTWNIVQGETIKTYPDIMTIVTFYSFFGTIQSVVVALIAERDTPSAWIVTDHMEIINIILSAVYGSVIRSAVQVWCLRRKGPFFVAIFKPFTIFVALTLGFLFFGNGLHVGSVIGALVVAVGYYSVMWGQIKEEEARYNNDEKQQGSSNSAKTPLLQDHDPMDEQV